MRSLPWRCYVNHQSSTLRSATAKVRRRVRYVLQVLGEALEPGEAQCVRCRFFDHGAGQRFLAGDTPFARAAQHLSPAEMAGSAVYATGSTAVEVAKAANQGLVWSQFGRCDQDGALVAPNGTCGHYAYDWRRGS